MEGLKKEFDLIQNEKVPEEELAQIKNYLKGTYILDHQTNGQRAHYVGWWQTMGLESSYDTQYTLDLEAVTPEQIQATAQKCFSAPAITVETLPKNVSPVKVAG